MENLTNIVPVSNIRELRIGDMICRKGNEEHTPLYVVAIFADPTPTPDFQPEDNTGTIYADFPDNPGDVIEFTLEEIDKITNEYVER